MFLKHTVFWGLLLTCMKHVWTWEHLYFEIPWACPQTLFFSGELSSLPFNTTSCLHFGAQILEDIIKAISSLKAYFKSSLHSISYNYMACLFVGPFSNTKWNVTLNSIIVNYKNYLLWKMKSGHTSGNPTNSKLPVYKNVF